MCCCNLLFFFLKRIFLASVEDKCKTQEFPCTGRQEGVANQNKRKSLTNRHFLSQEQMEDKLTIIHKGFKETTLLSYEPIFC